MIGSPLETNTRKPVQRGGDSESKGTTYDVYVHVFVEDRTVCPPELFTTRKGTEKCGVITQNYLCPVLGGTLFLERPFLGETLVW